MKAIFVRVRSVLTLLCINSVFRNYQHLCYQTNVASYAPVHHNTTAIYRIVRTLRIGAIQERENNKNETLGIYHDRQNRRKKENNMYTIMTTLTLMTCTQNDIGHNSRKSVRTLAFICNNKT